MVNSPNIQNAQSALRPSDFDTSIEYCALNVARGQAYALLALAEQFERFNDILENEVKVGGAFNLYKFQGK
jgi:hypothetical protein